MSDWSNTAQRLELRNPPAGGAGLSRRARLSSALKDRLGGPGFYYNSGNLLGLAMGIAVQAATAWERPAGESGIGATVLDYFAGNASAVAMTGATLIFLLSGEIYHRAWPRDGAPDTGLNRLADLLSAAGALVLGYGLYTLGHPFLALTAGLLHAAGKLGSAVMSPSYVWPSWPGAWPDPFRSAVVASRLPAILASGADLMASLRLALAGGPFLHVVTPATLLACYLLWTRADLLLFEGDDTPSPTPPQPHADDEGE